MEGVRTADPTGSVPDAGARDTARTTRAPRTCRRRRHSARRRRMRSNTPARTPRRRSPAAPRPSGSAARSRSPPRRRAEDDEQGALEIQEPRAPDVGHQGRAASSVRRAGRSPESLIIGPAPGRSGSPTRDDRRPGLALPRMPGRPRHRTGSRPSGRRSTRSDARTARVAPGEVDLVVEPVRPGLRERPPFRHGDWTTSPQRK